MTELEWANMLGDLLESKFVSIGLPGEYSVAIFVFKHEPEREEVSLGYVSNLSIKLLRKYLHVWWKNSKPMSTKETVQ